MRKTPSGIADMRKTSTDDTPRDLMEAIVDRALNAEDIGIALGVSPEVGESLLNDTRCTPLWLCIYGLLRRLPRDAWPDNWLEVAGDPRSDRNKRILALAHMPSFTLPHIAEMCGISRQRVHQILQSHGVQRTWKLSQEAARNRRDAKKIEKGARKRSKERRARTFCIGAAAALQAMGYSDAAIREDTGATLTMLAKERNSGRLPARRIGRRALTQQEVRAAMRMLQHGYSTLSVARHLDVSPGSIYARRRKGGGIRYDGVVKTATSDDFKSYMEWAKREPND